MDCRDDEPAHHYLGVFEEKPYHGRSLTILYDKTGLRYGKGRGLRVLPDGREIGSRKNLGILTIKSIASP